MMNRSKPLRYLLITLLFMMLAGCSQELSEKQDPLPAPTNDSAVATDASNDQVDVVPSTDTALETQDTVNFLDETNETCDLAGVDFPDLDLSIVTCKDTDVINTLFNKEGEQQFKGNFDELITFCGDRRGFCERFVQREIDFAESLLRESADVCFQQVSRQSRRLLEDNSPRTVRYAAQTFGTFAVYGVGTWGIQFIDNNAASATATTGLTLALGYFLAKIARKSNLSLDQVVDASLAGLVTGVAALRIQVESLIRSQGSQQLETCPSRNTLANFLELGTIPENSSLP